MIVHIKNKIVHEQKLKNTFIGIRIEKTEWRRKLFYGELLNAQRLHAESN